MKKRPVDWISQLDMEEHPEGGYYKRTYIADNSVYYESHKTQRPSCTAIYYLLSGEDFSALHILKSDEIWHYYDGTCNLIISIIESNEKMQQFDLGITEKAQPQKVIPANKYFGAELSSKNDDDFVLVGCTVSPGFDFEDFELAESNKLINEYPNHKEWINCLTRK